MNVVDSCGWLEYFFNQNNADFFAPALLDTAHLLVPSITIFEVSRKLVTLNAGPPVEEAVALMCKGKVIDLSPDQLAMAAKSAKIYGLAMADAIIWQTAQIHGAALYTQDVDFKDAPNVKFKAKKLAASKK
jgi:toxin FitB